MALDEWTEEFVRLGKFHERRVLSHLGEGSSIIEVGAQIAKAVPNQGWAIIYARDPQGVVWKYESDFFYAEQFPDAHSFSKATRCERMGLTLRMAWDGAVHPGE